tara:strand:- start:54 stop:1118 length:1065 start_codon:yes stop_codon:yes gene_type:complete
MAYKKYAYYSKGNKLALVEKSTSTSSGTLAVAHCTLGGYSTQATCEAAGGQWIPGSSGSVDTFNEYKSPVESITNGLEIQYTYAPVYRQTIHDGNTVLANNLQREVALGYSSYKGNLIIFINSGLFSGAAYDAVTPVGSYIKISKGSQWNGLHKIKERWYGALVLETKLNQAAYWYDNNIDVNTAGYFDDANNAHDYISVGDWVGYADNASANVLNTGNVFAKASSLTTNRINFTTILTATYDGTTDVITETEAAEALVSTQNNISSSHVFKAVKDTMIVDLGIEYIEDENFDIDLPRNLSNAVVYYVRAKMMEDMGELERKEYFMREFKRAVERTSSSRVYGPKRIQSFWGLR